MCKKNCCSHCNFFGSKKSPPISRVNKHQYNNNKRVRRESSFLEIVRGEGIRSAQLGKSLLLRNQACWIHPLEFRCAEPRERLQEERQPGAPCHVSSESLLLRNQACWIHPLEFRCAEPRERLQEERQPGAPCHVSSDDVWRVAVNDYETTRS